MPRMPQPPIPVGKLGLELTPDRRKIALLIPHPDGEVTRIEMDADRADDMHQVLGRGLVLMGRKPRLPPPDH